MLHIFLSNRVGEVRYGNTGKPVPGYDVRLIGDDGEPVAQGEMGELPVRGPTSAVMYWNNREQSRATFLGEWTRSGDKYIEDKDGYYLYCGRPDDMLKVGGMYVAPFEVEGVLLGHPDVLEAAVVAWRTRIGWSSPRLSVLQGTGAGRREDGTGPAGICQAETCPTNIRAGSNSAPSCRRPRPARFKRFVAAEAP
jgi:benzoate-CoA ligase